MRRSITAVCINITEADGRNFEEVPDILPKVIAAESENNLWISAQTGTDTAKLLHLDGTNWKEYSTPAALKELPTGILVTGNEMYWHLSWKPLEKRGSGRKLDQTAYRQQRRCLQTL